MYSRLVSLLYTETKTAIYYRALTDRSCRCESFGSAGFTQLFIPLNIYASPQSVASACHVFGQLLLTPATLAMQS
jgi:hypothetical protein